MLRKLAFTFVLVLLIGVAVPAGAVSDRANGQGYIAAPFGVGYFYGTFGEDPNTVLLVGGTAQDFCDVAEAEDISPFDAEPGEATVRVFERQDGSEELKVNSKDQPIHLYDSGDLGALPFMDAVCAEYWSSGDLPEPFASGEADLKVRNGIDGDVVDVFNSVNGTATGVDGTEYKVRASADLVVIDGELQGNPADFVELELREIKRR